MLNNNNKVRIHLNKSKVRIAPGADIMVHVVPVVRLQFFRCEGNPGHFVCIVIRRVETVAIVNIERRVWMPETRLFKHVDYSCSADFSGMRKTIARQIYA